MVVKLIPWQQSRGQKTFTQELRQDIDILLTVFRLEKMSFIKKIISREESDAQFKPGSHLRLTWVWRKKGC